MLAWLFRRTRSEDQVIIDAVVGQTAGLIEKLQHTIDLRFTEMSAQLKDLELGLTQLETKLLTKDLRDKQAYGLLHYKLHESKNPKLDEEIEQLKDKLSSPKRSEKDH